MDSILQERSGISPALLMGLFVESGPVDQVESRSVEVAPKYIELLRATRAHFERIDPAELSERKLLFLTASLLQMQDFANDLDSNLRAMLDSGRAEIAGQQFLVQSYIHLLSDELDWLDNKIETLSMALDQDFMRELNRRIGLAPKTPIGNPDWKQELASLCD
jgi:hypothetical protein